MDTPMDFTNIYPAVFKCFGVIICGYAAGRLNIITKADSKGLGVFVGKFALPSLIFLSMAKLDFSNVNWYFILSICISKSIVFFIVVCGTILLSRNQKFGKAGLFGMFCTQSNDFALGYPIISALYSEAQPTFVSYLYLIAPITFLILNPIGFFLLATQGKLDRTAFAEQVGRNLTVFALLKQILVNPNVFMTLLGIIANYLFRHEVPLLIGSLFELFSAAFSAPALFLLGLHMVGQFHRVQGLPALVPWLLIIFKSLFLPLIIRQVSSSIVPASNSSAAFTDFGFLYGTFPSAPGAFVYSLESNIESSLLASAMVLNTFLSAPLIIVSAKVISLSNLVPQDYTTILQTFFMDSHIVSVACCGWVIFMLFITSKYKRIIQNIVLHISISQFLMSVGVVLWSALTLSDKVSMYMAFSVYCTARLMIKFSCIILIILLFAIVYKSLCFALKWKDTLLVLSYCIPVILTAIIAPWISTGSPEFNMIPDFSFGCPMLIFNIVSDLAFLIFTPLVMVIFVRKFKAAQLSLENLDSNIEADDPDIVEIPDIEDLVLDSRCDPSNLQNISSTQHVCVNHAHCSSAETQRCHVTVAKYYEALTSEFEDDSIQLPVSFDEEHDMTKIMLMLIFITLIAVLSASVNIWYTVIENRTGIFVELVFLDGTLGSGLAFILLLLFGTEFRILGSKLRMIYRKYLLGSELVLPVTWASLTPDKQQYCLQFTNYYLKKCLSDINFTLRLGNLTHSQVFKGESLINWLHERGLVQDNQQAVMYGEALLEGGVIEHISQKHYFHRRYHYRFIWQKTETAEE